MKRIFTAVVGLWIGLSAFAQAPEKMSYQAVVRDVNDALLTNTSVGLKLSVLQGSSTGSAVYAETHNASTNQNGLLSVSLGDGVVISGTISGIDWGLGPYFLRSETDPSGGTTYSISGTQELLSVPYALYAVNAPQGPAGPPGPQGPGACDANTKDSLIVVYNTAQAFGLCQDANGNGTWVDKTIGGTNHSGAASKTGVVVYNTAQAHAFYRNLAGNGTWLSQTIGGTSHSAISTDNAVVLYNTAMAFAFYVDQSGTGVWVSQAIGGTNHSSVAHGNKIMVYNTASAFSFSVNDSGVGSWVAHTIGGTSHSVITTK